ncbi:carboxypeptidase-like regulatory domain-containing protein [Ferruginibacter sp. SUN002]|uniref:carboxypeptidase-like regulatory domain-containing protein n=1 Tax=Ferruginibacter sp. SUN002 TaxID=2937789 RepID=UPI003D369244
MDNQYTYTAADIHRYLSGKMNTAEMHAIEKAALDDPLLAEAIDGYSNLPGFEQAEGFEQTSTALKQLREKISAPTAHIGMVRKMRPIWRAAAAILVLAGGTALAIFINNSSKEKPVAPIAKTETNNVTQSTEPIKEGSYKIITDTAQQTISTPTLSKKEKQATEIIADKTPTQDDVTDIPTTNEKDNAASKNAASAIADEERKKNVPAEILKPVSTKVKAENPTFKQAEHNNKEVSAFFSGKVTDKNNTPIPFVTITTASGLTSTTDNNGEFRLPIAKANGVKATFKANNFQPKSVEATGKYQLIVLESKKIINHTKSNAAPGQANVLYNKGAEPAEGWSKYIDFLVDQISYSEYDTGKPVIGETIVSFEIDRNGEPTNFVFIKQIDEDVNDAVKELIINGPEWKITDKNTLPANIKLKLNF